MTGPDTPLPAPIARRCGWWRRCGRARRFRYVDADGAPIRDDAALERIRGLVLPPAWREVRICPTPRGGLQALGIDDAGRVQYRYSQRFVARRQAAKFGKLAAFGEALPRLRADTDAHLVEPGVGYERALAVAVRLVESLYFRVGSEAGAARYHTFGVTTLLNQHARFDRKAVRFSFVGKHGIRHRRILADPELVDALRAIQALQGKRLLQYRGEDGAVHPLRASDINAYLKRALGPTFSAKDFRTWGGTLEAARILARLGPAETQAARRRNVAAALRGVAELLGNTPAVCRSAYVHPAVLARYEEGITLSDVSPRRRRRLRGVIAGDDRDERALLALIAAAP